MCNSHQPPPCRACEVSTLLLAMKNILMWRPSYFSTWGERASLPMHVLYRQEAWETVNKMTSAVGHFPRCPPESPEKIAARSADVCRENRTQSLLIEGHKKVLRAVSKDHTLSFTSQAIPLDSNKLFHSAFLHLFDSTQKQTYSMQAATVKQKLQLCNSSSSVHVSLPSRV